MKRKISLIALLMAILMVFSACGSGGSNSKEADSSEATASTANAAEKTKAETQGPPVDLTMAFLVTGSIPADLQLVEDEVNKIVTPAINAKIKLMPLNFGAAMQQYNLMLSSGEKLDLMITFPTTYTSLVGQGRIQEIGPLLDEYGQGVKDALGNYLKGSMVNGKIYGVRPISEIGGNGGFVVRKDIVDKYGIDLSGIKTFSDIGNVLKAIKDKEPNAYPLGISSQGMSILQVEASFKYDTLSDSFGVLMDYGQDLKVVNYFESQEYKDKLKLMRDWYQKGYIMQSIATSKEDQHTLIKTGKVYSYISPSKPGIATQESAQNGYDCYVQEYSKPFASTFNVSLWQWVVPVSCKTPDKAVQMLNLMYTNADLENLLAWGIEGKHYEKKSDGTIGFPSGVTDKTSGYFTNQPWMFGNEFLTHVWTGNPADIWEQTKKFNESAVISKAMGFAFDSTSVKSEVVALNNIWQQYRMGLENGAVDPEKIYPQFISKLKAAGIEKVIAEKQKQLDAWAQQNNVK
ncbi:putative aldouronate transport system substrate-binding protein [Anaerobacterium chartisolvens]|uniref:Putative aldouronate transport system substrate-binding protein n=1 Tax=Anaerobacterium chartisolvens TaxID=1297424 RepID=A0A369ALB9_9FIRM|nr:ABC transporter substrate-binding protein [Anaerobacterium chartisolvens]RCX09913.1 putative aldouronate transport system substrate-binding protein [Anaerobacterium chartisolvens]